MVNGGLRAGAGLNKGDRIWSCLMVKAREPAALAAALTCDAPFLLLRLGGCENNDARASVTASARAFLEAARKRPRSPKIFVEVAPTQSAAIEADLDALIPAAPYGVVLECCQSRADLQQISVKLAVREAEVGLEERATKIMTWVRTPKAVIGLSGFAGVTRRAAGLAFDAVSLSAALGVAPDSPTLAAARAQFVLGAAAAGIAALDLAPPGDVAAACALARRDGFTGMIARQPEQIAAIEAAFRDAR